MMSGTRTEADLQRLRILNASLSLFRDHWLVGVGFGGPNFKDAFQRVTSRCTASGLFLFHSHNTVVDVLACTGLVARRQRRGWCGGFRRLALRALRAAPAALSSEGIGMAVSIAVFLVMGHLRRPRDAPEAHADLRGGPRVHRDAHRRARARARRRSAQRPA